MNQNKSWMKEEEKKSDLPQNITFANTPPALGQIYFMNISEADDMMEGRSTQGTVVVVRTS